MPNMCCEYCDRRRILHHQRLSAEKETTDKVERACPCSVMVGCVMLEQIGCVCSCSIKPDCDFDIVKQIVIPIVICIVVITIFDINDIGTYSNYGLGLCVGAAKDIAQANRVRG